MQQPIWLIYAEGETSKGCVVHCGALGKTGAPLWTEFLQGDKDFTVVREVKTEIQMTEG